MAKQHFTIVSCVTVLCTALHEGADILSRIKVRRKGLDISAQDLELSITRGESAVNALYNTIFQRLGESFAQGDREHDRESDVKDTADSLQRSQAMPCERYAYTSKVR